MQPAVAGPGGEMQRGGRTKTSYAEWSTESPSTSRRWAARSAVPQQVFGVVTRGHGRGIVPGGWRRKPHAAPGTDPHPPIQGVTFNSFWGEAEMEGEMKRVVHSHVKKLRTCDGTGNCTWLCKPESKRPAFILWLSHKTNSPFKIISFRGGLGVHL